MHFPYFNPYFWKPQFSTWPDAHTQCAQESSGLKVDNQSLLDKTKGSYRFLKKNKKVEIA